MDWEQVKNAAMEQYIQRKNMLNAEQMLTAVVFLYTQICLARDAFHFHKRDAWKKTMVHFLILYFAGITVITSLKEYQDTIMMEGLQPRLNIGSYTEFAIYSFIAYMAVSFIMHMVKKDSRKEWKKILVYDIAAVSAVAGISLSVTPGVIKVFLKIFGGIYNTMNTDGENFTWAVLVGIFAAAITGITGRFLGLYKKGSIKRTWRKVMHLVRRTV